MNNLKTCLKTVSATIVFAALASVALPALSAFAADAAGAPPAFLKQYGGSDVVDHVSRPFDQYKLGFDKGFGKQQVIEGQVTRYFYHIPKGHAALELLRNYQSSLEAAGFHRAYEHPVGSSDSDYVNGMYAQSWQTNGGGAAGMGGAFNWAVIQDMGATIEKGNIAGKDTTVVVTAVDFNREEAALISGKKVHFGPSELAVVVDIVTSAQVQTNMVSAADMADALATKGVIDLYGVYFDTDKTVVKPESSGTLDQVAALLKIDRSLKLEVSGHTDNTGDKAHNMTLSQGRADAVKAMLVSKYGIDAQRLTAKGYGDTRPVAPNTTDDGKTKNRRVELRKL